MADSQTYYDSDLTGAELDAALRKIPQMEASVAAAADSATLSKSWAQGGTGARAGEDANNAKYWCGKAQQATGFDPDDYYTRAQADTRYQLPVGYIFDWAPVSGSGVDLSTAAKVAAHFGYGTWKEITGRFTFGRDSAHGVGSTGGEEKHTLTKTEVPEFYNVVYGGSGGSSACLAGSAVYTAGAYSGIVQNVPLNNGGGGAHNNMPPYLTVYKWQRIA